MGKIKKGSRHHNSGLKPEEWAKADEDKITKPYVPTGNPKGRPKMADEDKVGPKPYVPTGKPRGRKKNPHAKNKNPFGVYIPTGKPRGRAPKSK